jgi:hypothetical protein
MPIDDIVLAAWFFALVGGAVAGLGLFQAVTGRPTFPALPPGINWSAGEIRLFGLAAAIYGLSIAVYVLVVGLALTADQLAWFFPIAIWPILLAWFAFRGLIGQHHKRRWPFKSRLARNSVLVDQTQGTDLTNLR